MRASLLLLVPCTALAACALYDGGRGIAQPDAAIDPADTTPEDAGVIADVGPDKAETGDPCDKDKDGYVDRFCGGIDCCDTDPGVHPGITDWFDVTNKCGRWDYNCDDLSEQEVHAGTDCSSCSDKYFDMPTKCGASGNLVTCSGGFFGCNKASATAVQRCR